MCPLKLSLLYIGHNVVVPFVCAVQRSVVRAKQYNIYYARGDMTI